MFCRNLKSGHSYSDPWCPAQGKRCTSCKRMNHFSGLRFCRRVAECSAVEQTADDDDVVHVFSIGYKKTDKLMAEANICSVVTPMNAFHLHFR